MENSKSTRSNTGYRNIYFEKEKGKFTAKLKIGEHITIHIGTYETLKEAKAMREQFIVDLF